MNPTQDQPIVFDSARGINDAVSMPKIKKGFIPFSCNLLAQGDVWDRRKGRDFYLLQTGFVLSIYTCRFEDNQVFNIAQIGQYLYNLSNTFSYLVANGTRLVIQSPDLNYWNITPNSSGLISPVVVAAPAAAAQTANFTVLNGESFGFIGSTGNVTRLTASQDYNGWYLEGYGITTAITSITTDMVFTVASGFSFRIQDYSGNVWKMTMDNSGNLIPITV